MVTFARLAMKGTRVPYANNLIECLMSEVASLIKNNCVDWSTKCLENWLNVSPIRYCNKRFMVNRQDSDNTGMLNRLEDTANFRMLSVGVLQASA